MDAHRYALLHESVTVTTGLVETPDVPTGARRGGTLADGGGLGAIVVVTVVSDVVCGGGV